MTDEQLKREARKQRALERLGTSAPCCGMCGEPDWRCMELHHVAGQKHDDTTIILCRNCHRKVSDDQKDHPVSDPNADALLQAIGRFLLGLADLLRRIIDTLTLFGTTLIERSAQDGEAVR